MKLETLLLRSPGMTLKIFIYFGALISLTCLPAAFWEKFLIFTETFFDKGKRRHGNLLERVPLLGEIKRGEKLLGQFSLLEAKLAQGQKTMSQELPRFKFYTGLLMDLFEAHRKLGVSLKLILPELRSNLLKELQFEKKILSLAMGGNAQFITLSLITWGFIIFSSTLVGIPYNFFIITLIAAIQIAGTVFFNIFFVRLKDRNLKPFSHALEDLYHFTGMVEIGRPVNQVLTETRLLTGVLVEHRKFQTLRERLFDLVNRWKESGLSPKADLQEMTREIWYEKERSYEAFIKQLELLKFCVLAFFFLPAYFLHLLSIFQFFMEQ